MRDDRPALPAAPLLPGLAFCNSLPGGKLGRGAGFNPATPLLRMIDDTMVSVEVRNNPDGHVLSVANQDAPLPAETPKTESPNLCWSVSICGPVHRHCEVASGAAISTSRSTDFTD